MPVTRHITWQNAGWHMFRNMLTNLFIAYSSSKLGEMLKNYMCQSQLIRSHQICLESWHEEKKESADWVLKFWRKKHLKHRRQAVGQAATLYQWFFVLTGTIKNASKLFYCHFFWTCPPCSQSIKHLIAVTCACSPPLNGRFFIRLLYFLSFCVFDERINKITNRKQIIREYERGKFVFNAVRSWNIEMYLCHYYRSARLYRL